MAQLSWGKPTIEFGKCVNGATPSEWTKLGCDPVEKFNETDSYQR